MRCITNAHGKNFMDSGFKLRKRRPFINAQCNGQLNRNLAAWNVLRDCGDSKASHVVCYVFCSRDSIVLQLVISVKYIAD